MQSNDYCVYYRHSISQKSPRTRSEANKDRSQGDSIVEEIEEDIEELSIEGDDLLRSEKSAVSRYNKIIIKSLLSEDYFKKKS